MRTALALVVVLGLMACFSAFCVRPITQWLVEGERAEDVLDEFSDLERISPDAIAPGGPRHGPGVRPAFDRSLPADTLGNQPR